MPGAFKFAKRQSESSSELFRVSVATDPNIPPQYLLLRKEVLLGILFPESERCSDIAPRVPQGT